MIQTAQECNFASGLFIHLYTAILVFAKFIPTSESCNAFFHFLNFSIPVIASPATSSACHEVSKPRFSRHLIQNDFEQWDQDRTLVDTDLHFKFFNSLSFQLYLCFFFHFHSVFHFSFRHLVSKTSFHDTSQHSVESLFKSIQWSVYLSVQTCLRTKMASVVFFSRLKSS